MQGTIQRLYERRVLTFNRKAAALGLRGSVTAAQLAALPLTCTYCGVGLDHRWSEFDHVIPFDRGGPNTIDNIVRCCRDCNRSKFTKTPAEHVAYQSQTWICPVDGKEFRPRHNDWKNGNGIVCSRSCAAKWRFLRSEQT